MGFTDKLRSIHLPSPVEVKLLLLLALFQSAYFDMVSEQPVARDPRGQKVHCWADSCGAVARVWWAVQDERRQAAGCILWTATISLLLPPPRPPHHKSTSTSTTIVVLNSALCRLLGCKEPVGGGVLAGHISLSLLQLSLLLSFPHPSLFTRLRDVPAMEGKKVMIMGKLVMFSYHHAEYKVWKQQDIVEVLLNRGRRVTMKSHGSCPLNIWMWLLNE